MEFHKSKKNLQNQKAAMGETHFPPKNKIAKKELKNSPSFGEKKQQKKWRRLLGSLAERGEVIFNR